MGGLADREESMKRGQSGVRSFFSSLKNKHSKAGERDISGGDELSVLVKQRELEYTRRSSELVVNTR